MRVIVAVAVLGLATGGLPSVAQELLPFNPPDTAKETAAALEWAFSSGGQAHPAYTPKTDEPHIFSKPSAFGGAYALPTSEADVFPIARDASRMLADAGCRYNTRFGLGEVTLTIIGSISDEKPCSVKPETSINIQQVKGLNGWAKMAVSQGEESGSIILPRTSAGSIASREWTLKAVYGMRVSKWRETKRTLIDRVKELQEDEIANLLSGLSKKYIQAALDQDDRRAVYYSSLSSIVSATSR